MVNNCRTNVEYYMVHHIVCIYFLKVNAFQKDYTKKNLQRSLYRFFENQMK